MTLPRVLRFRQRLLAYSAGGGADPLLRRLADLARFELCPDLSATRALARSARYDFVILASTKTEQRAVLRLAAELRRGRPAPEVVLLVGADSPVHAIGEAVRAGAHVVVCAPPDDGESQFRALLQASAARTEPAPRGERADAERRGERDEIAASFRDWTLRICPERCVPIFIACHALAHRADASVVHVAEACGMSTRAMRRRLARCGWPPPAELLQWARLFRLAKIDEANPQHLSRQVSRAGFTTLRSARDTAQRLTQHRGTLETTIAPARLYTSFEGALSRAGAADGRPQTAAHRELTTSSLDAIDSTPDGGSAPAPPSE